MGQTTPGAWGATAIDPLDGSSSKSLADRDWHWAGPAACVLQCALTPVNALRSLALRPADLHRRSRRCNPGGPCRHPHSSSQGSLDRSDERFTSGVRSTWLVARAKLLL